MITLKFNNSFAYAFWALSLFGGLGFGTMLGANQQVCFVDTPVSCSQENLKASVPGHVLIVDTPKNKRSKNFWQKIPLSPSALRDTLIGFQAKEYGTEKLSEENKAQVRTILRDFNPDLSVKLRKLNCAAEKEHGANSIFVCFNYLFFGSSFLKNMTPDKLRATLAHEIVHIEKNHTIKLFALKALLIIIPTLCAVVYEKPQARHYEVKELLGADLATNLGKSAALAGMVAACVFGVFRYIQRQCEYEADEGFAKYLVDKKEGIALLESYNRNTIALEDAGAPTALISAIKSYIDQLSDTHPTIDQRIARLKNS